MSTPMAIATLGMFGGGAGGPSDRPMMFLRPEIEIREPLYEPSVRVINIRYVGGPDTAQDFGSIRIKTIK